jgi:hypothetical protein
MKKLEDFECKKVELKTIYGGSGCQTWTSNGSSTNSYDGDDKCVAAAQ